MGKTATEISAPELFRRFTVSIAKEGSRPPSPRSIETRYKPLQKYLDQFLDMPVCKVNESVAGNFIALQLERITNVTAKARGWLLQSCWNRAKGKYQIAESNPWSVHIAKINLSQSEKAQPFTVTEIQMILNAFKNDRYYSHYYPMVYFLFGKGCRFGEVAGLKWKNSRILILSQEIVSPSKTRSTWQILTGAIYGIIFLSSLLLQAFLNVGQIRDRVVRRFLRMRTAALKAANSLAIT